MLLRLQTGFQGCGFAEVQESAHFEAKLRQSSNQRPPLSNSRLRTHIYIVSRYT